MPKKISYIVKNFSITPYKVMIIDLVPANGAEQFDFSPGQYAQIAFTKGKFKGKEHAFSIASSPLDKTGLQFGIKVFGQYTAELSKLNAGDEVLVRGPFGEFVLDERRQESIVLLAAGIGITPFMSMLRYANDRKLTNDISLIFSGRKVAEIPFYSEIRNFEKTLPNFHNYFYITDEKSDSVESCMNFGFLDSNGLAKNLDKKFSSRIYYVCGPAPFTKAMIECLKKFGVNNKNIITEGFSLVPINFFENGTHVFPIVAGTAVALTLVAAGLIYQANNQNSSTQPAISTTNNPPASYTEQLVTPKENENNGEISEPGEAPITTAPTQTQTSPSQTVAQPTPVVASPPVQPAPIAPTPSPTYRIRTRTS